MTKSPKLEAGTVVAGRYRVEREIGRGGMAQVYEARHTDIGKAVAVKVLAAEFTSSPVVVERFLREARAAAAVHSPYICDVYDSGKLDDGRPFLVMELLKGESLYERMVKVRQFDAETTARIVSHVARGLMKAHAASIVHRDLKPENIFLTVDEEGDLRAKVLDFGLAKFYAPTNEGGAQARLTREGAIFGTPAYMSPEQVQGQGTVDHRADLWALGCIAYECLTGRTVWSTDKGIAMTFAQIASAPLPKISRYRPDLPLQVEEWFERALARDAAQRFQSAKELAESFAAAVNHGTPSMLFSGEISRISASPYTEEMRRILADQGQGDGGSTSPRPAAGAPPEAPISGNAGVTTAPGVPAAPPTAPVPSGPTPPTQPSPDPHEPQESLPGDLGTSSTVKQTKPIIRQRRAARWPLFAVGAVCLAAGAAATWQIAQPRVAGKPPASASSAGSAPSAPSSAVPSTSSSQATAPEPPGGPRWQALIADGQAKLLAGDIDEAAKRFKEAQDLSSPVGKVMLDHLTVARENKGPCKLAALTRLRPMSVVSQSTGRPVLQRTARGLLALWTDDHETTGHEHIYAQLLDATTLKPEGNPVDVTPEADRVGKFAVAPVGDRVAVLYALRGEGPGLSLRWLEADGRVAAPPKSVAGAAAALASPALAVEGEELWASWEERGNGDQMNLMLGKLSASGPPVVTRLTDLRSGRFKPRVQEPDVALNAGNVALVFRTDRDAARPVSLLMLSATDPALGTGLPPAPPTLRDDRTLGKVAPLTSGKDKGDTPSITCAKEGCFASWHLEPAGPLAAFAVALVNPAKGDVPWSKRYPFAGHGGHPSLGVNDAGQVAASWYENSRIQIAPLTNREGLGSRSILARTGNDRAPPSVTGLGPRDWAIAWLDFEPPKGRLEPYALRATCR